MLAVKHLILSFTAFCESMCDLEYISIKQKRGHGILISVFRGHGTWGRDHVRFFVVTGPGAVTALGFSWSRDCFCVLPEKMLMGDDFA